MFVAYLDLHAREWVNPPKQEKETSNLFTNFMKWGLYFSRWITNAVATYVINELLNNESKTDIGSLLDTFDFHIVPVLNPDGCLSIFILMM